MYPRTVFEKLQCCNSHVNHNGEGDFFKLTFPLFHFATTGLVAFFVLDVVIKCGIVIGVSANYLMYLLWRAIRMLQLADLQVVCVVADGATPNRKFFRMHQMEDYMKSGVTYKVPNVCCSSRDSIYFIPDVPHLIKTIRNAWHNSQDKRSRHLVVGEFFTVWYVYYVDICFRTMKLKLDGRTLLN